jgi:hypothetical protein
MPKSSSWFNNKALLTLLVIFIFLIFQYDCDTMFRKDTRQQMLEAAIKKQILVPTRDVHYFAKWFDLNHDGQKEAVVYVASPSLCGSGGCNTYVFQWHASKQIYEQIGHIPTSQPPVMATPQRSEGWNNLRIRRNGKRFVEIHFQELRYRPIPSELSTDPVYGATLIEPYEHYLEGLSLYD